MSKMLMTILALISFAAAAAASEFSPAFNGCMSSAMSTASMRECVSQEVARQDARLTVAYHDAMARLSPSSRKHLREAQRAWIKWRDQTCQDAASGGTIAGVEIGTCLAREISRRTMALERR